MSDIKERIIGAISIMSDDDAKTVWAFIQDGYIVKSKTWEDIEEVEPESDELEIIERYISGDAEFQPMLSGAEVKKELDL